ncbi:MAG: hypothetical protein R3F37_17485 [Candidatus Competibacteraceae bacterium]
MSFHHYTLAGRILASTLPLPELSPTAATPAHFSFALLPPNDNRWEPDQWFHSWKPPGYDADDWLKFANTTDGYLLRFPGHADFFISSEGTEIQCHPLPSTPLETLRHLLLDQVLPLALSTASELVLHASAVVINRQAIGILGVTGHGKSTLAASFANAGYPLVTDDCLLLREDKHHWRAFPYYSGVRLWPDNVAGLFADAVSGVTVAHYTSKQRVSGMPVPFASDSQPLRQLFFLGPAETAEDQISIKPLSYREAFIELVKMNFLLDIQQKTLLKRQFNTIDQLLMGVACFELNYPRDYHWLPAVRTAILEHVAANSQVFVELSC